ncbi:winged helix-turn-helix domain-containing protein [Hydrocarboniphaga sp.]|uniref:winged helix-turn-helix domain-containing protein n=1 Tax=Hydrocarboniphaga sp. TaxID=2033016 RepID=UPI003D14DB5D
MSTASFAISAAQARAIWLQAQRLDETAPFGAGAEAVRRATEHLGYVQIDTINVIERSHHHILYTRIPDYRRADLEQAQSADKSVFEYWTHALAYVPTADYRYYARAMQRHRDQPHAAFESVDAADYAALLKRIRNQGALSIRDIDDDVLVEKDHPWGSRKPSRRALRLGFYDGDLTISKRSGMLKTYELSARHFGWQRRPAPASDRQFAQYLLDRALRSQGLISVDSSCYGNNGSKATVREQIALAVKRRQLRPVHLQGQPKLQHWCAPATLDATNEASIDIAASQRVHLLSPFDPLVIQRKRLLQFFGYEHRFEAYVPAGRRVFGYFALPVLIGDRIVAALDLKMDRAAGRLLMQKWSWIERKSAALKRLVEEELGRFEQFQKG